MIVTVFLVPESWSRWPMFYLKLNVLSCLGWFWRCTVVFRSGQSWVTVTVLRFSSFSRFWACRQHDEDLVLVGASLCCLSLQSSSLPPIATFAALQSICTSGVPTTGLQYGAEQSSAWEPSSWPTWLWLALQAWITLWVVPPMNSNGWLVLLPHKLQDVAGTWSHAVAHRVAPRIIVHAAKDILTGVKLAAACAQTARISHTSQHPSSLHMKTKAGLMVINIDLILHCVVLLHLECWKESAHHSFSLDQYMFYNIQPYICIIVFSLTIDLLGHETPCKRHKWLLTLTVTALCRVYHWGLSTVCSEDFHLPAIHYCQSSASSHIISCNVVSCQAEILPVEFRQHRWKASVRDRLP